MYKTTLALLTALALSCGVAWGQAAPSSSKPILAGPLANALAIPVVSLLVVPISLVGAIVPFDFVLQIAHFVLAGCFIVLERLSNLPAAVWSQHAPPGSTKTRQPTPPLSSTTACTT